MSGLIERDTLRQLIAEVEGRAPLAASYDHGSQHWRAVATAGAAIAEATGGADPDVLFFFGLFHDSQRVSEGDDPEHGRRGGELAAELMPELGLLSDEQLGVLRVACELHTDADPTDDATLGACWDSDRINLWRVGTEPRASFLSTDEAKRRIEWARDLHARNTPWEEVLDLYDALRVPD